MTDHVLLIEDDTRLAAMIVDYLGGVGVRVAHAGDGASGLALHEREAFDAIVLDLMLPDMDGLDVCRRIRAGASRPGGERALTPVLMLTARGDAMDRVIGLEIGADDYLAKPFEPRELLARIRALIRRSRAMEAAVQAGQAPATHDATRGELLRFGRLEIDKAAREVRLDGTIAPLTSYQFALILAMAEHAGRVQSRDLLMDQLKGETLEAFDRSIDVHISRIRAAIEDDPKKPRRIITVRGAGYVFAKAQD